jgi:hypothetical protein
VVWAVVWSVVWAVVWGAWTDRLVAGKEKKWNLI